MAPGDQPANQDSIINGRCSAEKTSRGRSNISMK